MAIIVIAHDSATNELAQWLEKVLKRLPGNVELKLVGSPEADFLQGIVSVLGEKPDPKKQAVVIAVFFDGTSDEAKAVFLPLKAWAAAVPNVVMQALNAKKGTHTLYQNEEALLASISKRLVPPEGGESAASATATSDKSASAGDKKEESSNSAPADSTAPQVQRPTAVDYKDISPEHIKKQVHLSQGECPWLVCAPSDKLKDRIEELGERVKEAECGMFPVTEAPRKLESGEEAIEMLIRRAAEESHIELRVAMCGNVDSGKSTLTSVLTRGYKDDGRGFARSKVFNHQHEQETGRTSSISENHLGFDANGAVVNYPPGGPSSQKHQISATDFAARSAKIVTLYDLAGHERYLKTTVLGMTRSLPDYACIVISANNGIQRMTKEHLGLCLALRLPFFIVVTRIDATPDNIRQETNQTIVKLLKSQTVKKLPYPVKKEDDLVVSAKNLMADRITPIFEVSNVTGESIPQVLKFINLLPQRRDWLQNASLPKELVVDSTFFVSGVGTVVGGVVSQGQFKPNDTVMLGPDGLGAFRPVQIRSIHVKGVDVDHVDCGNDAALCLKKEKRNAIRKGMVLVDPAANPKSYWQFEAEIRILYHSTTIANNYEPVIHSPTVRQSARITLVDQEVLRTGDHARVRFHFMYRPEYLKIGHRLVFREGRTKGIGTITKILEGMDPAVCGNQRGKAKDAVRERLKRADAAAAAAAAASASATATAATTKSTNHKDPNAAQ